MLWFSQDSSLVAKLVVKVVLNLLHDAEVFCGLGGGWKDCGLFWFRQGSLLYPVSIPAFCSSGLGCVLFGRDKGPFWPMIH